MHRVFALLTAIVFTLLATAACTHSAPCIAASSNIAVAETDADDADDADDPGCPTGLSCNEHGGCNSDLPYCCNGQCQKTACSSAGHP